MQNYVGTVLELRLEADGQRTARLTCPPKAIPDPGQYLLAHALGDTDAPLAEVLFPVEQTASTFLAAPPIPSTWQPGTTLHLRGPLGKGFRLPGKIRNLALVSLGDTPARLLPLLSLADNPALFLPPHLFSVGWLTTASPFLPVSLEINPLADLPDALRWADFLALDLPLADLPELPQILGLPKDRYLPCPAQALLLTPMPCGGLADCGVCAVGHGRKYQLACKDGPVFEVRDLLRGARGG